MIEFILNDQKIVTDVSEGSTVLNFVRKHRQMTGTKLVCREGECGACTVLVGNTNESKVEYQSMTSCIMPLANAHGKHIVTIEGLNMEELSPVQQAMVDEYGSQCGFCTPGFVVSLSGYLITTSKPTLEGIIASIDGNICRCTGYKSIERAAELILKRLKTEFDEVNVDKLIEQQFIPAYFTNIPQKLKKIELTGSQNSQGKILGGGTDLYVQRPYEMYEDSPSAVYDEYHMKQIEIRDGVCHFGASLTMGDLYRSTIFKSAIPDSDYIFKLLSSTQIRNMATIGGNLVNASPIGDFTILLLALDSSITLSSNGKKRTIPLKSFYKGYKTLDLKENEILEEIHFAVPTENSVFHFEKVSQRKFFDIASVNVASKLTIVDERIQDAHMAIGGVGPIPMYLTKTVESLKGKELNHDTVEDALSILQEEISPISDARGSAEYKRLLARQLLLAQFMNINPEIYQLTKLIEA